MRLGIPLGMAVTTAVWSSFSGHVLDISVAYSRTFVTTAAFASCSLAIAPFIRIGRQGAERREFPEEAEEKRVQPADHRPSKRWSIVDTISNQSSVASPRQKHLAGISALSSDPPPLEKNSNSSRETVFTDYTRPKLVWVVCEQCNASRRITNPVGDPTKYFNDICGTLEKPNHDMIVNGRRRFPLGSKNQSMNR
jgi:hypothetical protein